MRFGNIFIVIFIVLALVMASFNVTALTYTFDTESITTGYSLNPTYKNAEDLSYNTMIEKDQYTDTNFSGSSENVVVGTAGGGSFSSALDTDDATYRSYAEANTNPGDTTNYLYPTSDNSIGFDATYPTSPTTHFDKLDEGTSNDGDTSYNTAITNGDRDVFGVGDLSGITGTPTFHVVIHYFAMRASTGTSAMDIGIRIGSTDYVGINDNNAGASYVDVTYEWITNPSTSSAWTESEINALLIYMECSDATPDVKVTLCYLEIQIDYALNYCLDSQITYSSVTSNSQTISYYVYCQAYRSSAENFGVYVWNYVSSGWDSKTTVNQATDTDFNFDLTSEQRSSATNEVKIRIVGLTETSDTTQDTVYFDLLKVKRIEIGYGLDISLTSTSVPDSGDIVLWIKGYTSSERFDISVWDYTSSSWDADVSSVTALSNTWINYDLNDIDHRSTTDVKIRFEDYISAASDTTQSTLYLDVCLVNNTVSLTNNPPEFTSTAPTESHNNTAFSYDANAQDIDDYEDTLTFDLEGNITDWATINPSTGVVSGTPDTVGYYWMNISVSDGVNDLVWQNTSLDIISDAPVIETTPILSWENNTVYTYNSYASDTENEDLTYLLSGNITDWATINPVTGVVSGLPIVPGQYWLNLTVTDGINSDTASDLITIVPQEISTSEITQMRGLVIIIIIILIGVVLVWGML